MLPKDFKLKSNMKVKLRDDLVVGQKYGSNTFVSEMKRGAEVIIIKTNIGIYTDNFIIYDSIIQYVYTSEMVDYVISSDVTKKYTMKDLDKIEEILLKTKKINIKDLKVPWVITNIQNREQAQKVTNIFKLDECFFKAKEIVSDIKGVLRYSTEANYCAEHVPYKTYNFYDYNDISFDDKDKKTTTKGFIPRKSKIDTKAPKIVGVYRPAVRKYKAKKGE